MKTGAKKVALCGMLGALSAVILTLGGLVPAATFCCPMLASLPVLAGFLACGAQGGRLLFLLSAALGLLLGPDKEAAMLYAALGWYPLVKSRLDRRPRPVRLAQKLLLVNLAGGACYAILLFVFRLQSLQSELREAGRLLLLLLLAGGNAVFFLYDALLARLTPALQRRLQKFC